MPQFIGAKYINDKEYRLRYRGDIQGPLDAEGEVSGWYTLVIIGDDATTTLNHYRDPPETDDDHPSLEIVSSALFERAIAALDAGDGETTYTNPENESTAELFAAFCDEYDMEGSPPDQFRQFEHANEIGYKLTGQLDYDTETVRTIGEQVGTTPLDTIEV